MTGGNSARSRSMECGKTIAARLSEAKQTIPHFYLRRDIRLDSLLDLRIQINQQLEPRGIKLSVNDFVIKACALALQQVPTANAVWASDRILQLKPSDVAVAVAIEGGLFTPVIRDAHLKSLSETINRNEGSGHPCSAEKARTSRISGGKFRYFELGECSASTASTP